MGDGGDPGDEIAGWYDYDDFHRRAVAAAPPGAVLVEVGVFCGKSLVGLGRLAKAAGKGLRVVGVDTFLGSPEHFAGPDAPLAGQPVGVLAQQAVQNLHLHRLFDTVTLLGCESTAAARWLALAPVFAAFIDAAHDEASVAADIAAWRRVVLPGGMLGGHDYGVFDGVTRAADAAFPGLVVPAGRSWWEVQL